MSRFTVLFIVIATFLLGIPTTIFAQEEESENPWVYASEYQIPWERMGNLDSLLKLETTKAWRETAIKMGFIIDQRWYIHHTGGEWNLKIEGVYSSWNAIYNPERRKKVSEAVFPDADKRKANQAAWDKVFNGVIHRDNIYRLALGN